MTFRSAILDHLEAHHPDPALYPTDAVHRLATLLLEVLADEWMPLIAMHTRWNTGETNRRFIHMEFGSGLLPKAPVADAPWALVTGGVHGYETSGVQGALDCIEAVSSAFEGRVNLVVTPGPDE